VRRSSANQRSASWQHAFFSPSGGLCSVSIPGALGQTGTALFSKNDAKPYFKTQTLPTAIDNISPNHSFIRTISGIPLAPSVDAHSVIALYAEGGLENGRDGVVKYVSAQIDSVGSERAIRSPHACQSNADTIDEMGRILRLRAADVACLRQDLALSAVRGAVHP
jgi:hypothetical protein